MLKARAAASSTFTSVVGLDRNAGQTNYQRRQGLVWSRFTAARPAEFASRGIPFNCRGAGLHCHRETQDLNVEPILQGDSLGGSARPERCGGAVRFCRRFCAAYSTARFCRWNGGMFDELISPFDRLSISRAGGEFTLRNVQPDRLPQVMSQKQPDRHVGPRPMARAGARVIKKGHRTGTRPRIGAANSLRASAGSG